MTFSESELEARLAEIRRSYLVSLQAKHEDMQTFWSELCEQWNDETYRKLYMIVHSLAGSAETFGFAEVSADARALVEQLRPLAEATDSTKPSAVLATMDAEYKRLLASLALALPT